MNRLAILTTTSCLVITGCATMDDQNDDIDDIAGATDDLATESAEPQVAPGPSPSIVKGGSSTAQVISSVTAGYSGLEISGARDLGSYLVATYYPGESYDHAIAQFTVTAAPGAAFVYSLKGTGSGYSQTHLRLERPPGTNELRAATATSIVTCGALPSSTPTTVQVSVAASSHRFNVAINGAPTACTNLSTKIGSPIIGFEMMDASNAGYGGVVRFEALDF